MLWIKRHSINKWMKKHYISVSSHYNPQDISIYLNVIINNWLVVLTLWKIWKSIGMSIPNIWENKSHVPNHQPDKCPIFVSPSTGDWLWLHGSAPSSFSKALVVVLAWRARSTAAPKAPKVTPSAADPPVGQGHWEILENVLDHRENWWKNWWKIGGNPPVSWNIAGKSRCQWRFLARNIIRFYGGFSSTPCLSTRGYYRKTSTRLPLFTLLTVRSLRPLIYVMWYFCLRFFLVWKQRLGQKKPYVPWKRSQWKWWMLWWSNSIGTSMHFIYLPAS